MGLGCNTGAGGSGLPSAGSQGTPADSNAVAASIAVNPGITVGLEVLLSCQASTGTISSYLWTLVQVPSGSLLTEPEDANEVDTRFVPDLPGSYRVRLTVANSHASDATIADILIAGAPPPMGQTLMAGRMGDSLDFGPVDAMVPAGMVIADIVITVTPVPTPAGLPAGLEAVGQAWDIDISDIERLDGPLIVEIEYDDAGMVNEEDMLVLHWDGTQYVPVTILSQDLAANRIRFDSRDFSIFLPVLFDATQIPVDDAVPGFTPTGNGWDIANSGQGYFTPGGNCLGMSACAAWFLDGRSGQALFGHFPRAETRASPS